MTRPPSVTASQQSQLSDNEVSLPQNKLHYPALDGLRACAVLMVFVQHYFLSLAPKLWQWGWAGVDVFFVLSGFLITGILYDTQERTHRFRNFYIRRTLRIFPLYYGVLLIVFLLTPFLRWNWNITWLYWPFYLENYVRFLYVQMFVQSQGFLEALSSPVAFLHAPIRLFLGHFWSLGVEEQFYLLWPLVVFTVKDRVKLRSICVAVVLILPCIRLIAAIFMPHQLIKMEILYRATPFRIDALLLGGLLALIIRGPEARHLTRFIPKLIPACIALLLLPPLVASLVRYPVHLNASNMWMGSFGFSVIDLLSACAIWVALQSGSLLFRLLTIKSLRWLGTISYGFYVFHDIPHPVYISIATWLVGQHPRIQTIVTLAIAFVSTLALSYLSFRFFETPFLRLKDRLAPSKAR
jgi:peptidoglycan/LPS O-acetylase OafA/YrhL